MGLGTVSKGLIHTVWLVKGDLQSVFFHVFPDAVDHSRWEMFKIAHLEKAKVFRGNSYRDINKTTGALHSRSVRGQWGKRPFGYAMPFCFIRLVRAHYPFLEGLSGILVVVMRGS